MIQSRLIHFGFLIPLLAFIGHQVLQYGFNIQVAFVDSYLDPFCASAMACYLINVERWYYFGEQELHWLDVSILVVFLSLVSELLFPMLSERFVGDPLDVIPILLGGAWFLLMARKS